MRISSHWKSCVLAGGLAAAAPVFAADGPDDTQARVSAAAAQLAADMARLCPVADPGDSAAYEACRKGLYADSSFKRVLSPYVLWGRQRDPAITLKDSKLTQFGPDVLTGLYASLFMFNGKHDVVYVEREGLWQVRLQAAFRNRLAPGQFPYPFWHEAEKWAMYEKANEVILWWDAKTSRIKVAQFTVFGKNEPLVASAHVTPPAFDGKWMWTDAQGKTQPIVTLFDGLLRADNPYAPKVETAYRSFALKLREGQCFDCHVPNNPNGMKKLVLLQTPMHAAAEIKRVMKSVRDDRMPRDKQDNEVPLEPKLKDALLAEGAAFERVLDSARQWEAERSAGTDSMLKSTTAR
ncbi:MAG: hypothetical protein ACJ8G7_19960 [Rhizobacter sp.]